MTPEERREAFEHLASDPSHKFRRSPKGTYVNPAVARDWKWFNLGFAQATVTPAVPSNPSQSTGDSVRVEGDARQWQPIETADKHDGPFWLYSPELVEEDFCPAGVVDGQWQDDVGWMGAVWDGYRDEWHAKVIHPTHWMKPWAPDDAALAQQAAPAAGSQS